MSCIFTKLMMLCLQTFVNALLVIVLAGPGAPVLPETTSGIHGSHRSEYGAVFHIVPPTFCSAVVKLVAMQMQALGVSESNFTKRYSSSWKIWPLHSYNVLSILFILSFQGPVLLGANLWRECVCFSWQVYQHAGQLHIASLYQTGMCQKGYQVNLLWILRNFKVIVIHVQNYTCIITCRYIHVLTISHDLFHKLSHSSQETLPSWEQTMWPLPWRWSWIFCVPLRGTPNSSRTPAPSPPYITCPSRKITAVAASVSQTRSTGQRTSYCSMWLI